MTAVNGSGRIISTEQEVSELPRGSVLLCKVNEVFWLPPSSNPSNERRWLAAGYDPVIDYWTDDQVADDWGPLTVLLDTTPQADLDEISALAATPPDVT